MVTARDAHMRAVDAGGSKAIHSLTRHGAQTGRAAQLQRICTKLTSGQPYDEQGTNPIVKVLRKHTKTRMKGAKEITYKLKNRTGGGIAAGVFYSPAVQSPHPDGGNGGDSTLGLKTPPGKIGRNLRTAAG